MARRLGIATATLSKYRSIIKLPGDAIDSIARLLDEKKITFETAYRMSGLSLWMAKQFADCIDKSPDKKIDVKKLRELRDKVNDEDTLQTFSKARLEKVLIPSDSKQPLDAKGVRNLEKVDFRHFIKVISLMSAVL